MAAQPATFADAMTKVLTDVAAASVLPDSDLQFTTQLQAAIVSRLRQGVGPPPGQGGMGRPPGQPMQAPPGAGAPGMGPGGPPPGMGGGPPPGMMAGPPGQGGVSPAGGPPNVDELRRMLAGQAGA
jgi:hypothetical protein